MMISKTFNKTTEALIYVDISRSIIKVVNSTQNKKTIVVTGLFSMTGI